MATARVFATYLSAAPGQISADTLILTGSQAIDDLEGELAPCLAEMLALPFVGVVTATVMDEGARRAVVTKEFSGGLRAEFEVSVPAVLGIQAAEKAPRYVPVAKVRLAMKSAKIEAVSAEQPEAPSVVAVDKMYKPEVAGRAQMLEGTPEEIANRIVEILAERGIV
jgi:electron transfer flavoprotein beta subunit